jgi:multicomponent Na+:H+ antiporter subunit D
MAAGAVPQEAATLMDHLPVLVVLIPFLAAPLSVLIGSRRLVWPLAFAASLGAFAVAWLMLAQVIGGGILSYHLGGWAPPIGIEYRVDAANAFVLLLVTGIATIILPYARASIGQEVPERHHTLFYALFLLCLTGLLGVAVTGDAFNVFVFLEISSLSTYVLIAQGSYRHKRALTTAYNYLIMGTIGATFFVIGIGFLYMATGTLNMADLAERIAAQGDSRTIRAAFAFIVVGIGLKVAIYPLHLWLPNAYTFAPSAVSAFLAATATKVAVYVLMRFLFSVFQPGFTFEVNTLQVMIIPLALLAMFTASFIAIFQNNFKRMLAYSSIAQIGYMLLGIGFLTETGLTAAIVHLFNHGITKAVMFMVAGAFVMRSGGAFYRNIEGIGRVMPWTTAAGVIGGLSLIGVPGTAGFISKWMLVEAALEKGWWWMALLVVASSLLAVLYVWRGIEVLYLKSPDEEIDRREAPLSMLIPIWILAIACLWFGLATDVTLGAARSAAEGLMAGPTPLDLGGAAHGH